MPESYTLAFGPFAANWRNPQRLVLSIVGDLVADAVYHSGYNERGCAERLPRLTLEPALHLVGRVCAMSSHAHTLAFCQAWERLTGRDIPRRAAYLRCIVAEIERVSSHLSVLVRLFDTLGLTHYREALLQLGEQSRHAMQQASGRRIIPDLCLPGGVRRNLSSEQQQVLLEHISAMQHRLTPLIERILGDSSLSARTVNVGTLALTTVEQLGLSGPLARASGQAGDTRWSQPYAAYPEFAMTEVVEQGGDVYARLVAFLLESFESLKLVEQALLNVPGGAWEGSLGGETTAGQASSVVESPYGTLRYTLESDGRRITRAYIEPPRQLDRLLARALLTNALLDNVMLIVLSTDTSVACSEG